MNSGEKIGVIGIVINILIALPKIILGIIGNSISLFTDGINNACDSITGIVTYAGLKISKKPGDSDHPYGHGRAEYMAGFLIALFTAVVGVQFFISSVKKFIYPNTPEVDTLARLFLIASIIFKCGYVYINHLAYKKTSATLFRANRQDSMMDIIISTFILISSFFFKGHEWMDSALGLLISILILYQAWDTLKDTITPLIGPSPKSEDIELITNTLNRSKLITNIHGIYVDRQSMGQVIATADVEVDPELTVLEVHDEIEMLTSELKRKTNIDLTVHVEPMIVDKKRMRIKNLLMKIDGVTGVHDLLLKNENYVTLAISLDELYDKDEILIEAQKILQREGDKKWNIDSIASFNKKTQKE